MSHKPKKIKYQNYDNHWCCNNITGSTCLTKIKSKINPSAMLGFNSNRCRGEDGF